VRFRRSAAGKAIAFCVSLGLAGCASRAANPTLDDYSDGVLSHVVSWFERAVGSGERRAPALPEMVPASGRPSAIGIASGEASKRWNLGSLEVAESSASRALPCEAELATEIGDFVARIFSKVVRREITIVGFERRGKDRFVLLRPFVEGRSAGVWRQETGLWEARVSSRDGTWYLEALRQVFWRQATCARPLFEDRTAAAGLAGTVHRSSRPLASRNVPVPGEHLPPGIAVLDFDGDGREDFLVTGGEGNHLFRNLGDGTFQDVAERAGVRGPAGREAVGALAFDYDNDGHQDLYVTYFDGPNLLFHNRGDGTFEEVGAKAGVALSDWCTAAAAFDYDRDGLPDLYVLVYGRPEHGPNTKANNAAPNHLFHNNGDGTFTDVTAASGTGDTGWALAVASFDADEDGWPDLYVANDFGANVLLRNRRDGTFENVASAAGVRDDGFGMGVTVADYDGDGHLDLYVSNYSYCERWFLRDRRYPMPPFPYSLARPIVSKKLMELARGSSLFRWIAPLKFGRVSNEADVWDTSWSWGTVFLDAFLRGRPDLFVVNGMVSGKNRTEHEIDFWNAMSRSWMEMEKNGTPPGDWGDDSLWGHVPKRFFVNLDGQRFADVAGIVGLFSEGNQRGVAVLDVNGDGAPDLVAAGFLQPPQLWVNQNPDRHLALTVSLEGDAPAPGRREAAPPYRTTRDALGAVVSVEAPGLPLQTRVLTAGDSFLSSSSKSLFFGLASEERATRVTVRWPSGKVSERRDVPAGPVLIREKD
jgi:hypothetical protein